MPLSGRPNAKTWIPMLEKEMKQHNVYDDGLLTIGGIRAYYRDSMGLPGLNDDGIFDDAVGIIYPKKKIAVAFNATLDAASSTHKFGAPQIAPGLHKAYRLDYHKYEKGRLAVCQRLAPIKVWRVKGKFFEWGYFGVNIHDSRTWSTWSQGCTTIPKDNGQYGEFIDTVVDIQKSIHGTAEKSWMLAPINYLVKNNY